MGMGVIWNTLCEVRKKKMSTQFQNFFEKLSGNRFY